MYFKYWHHSSEIYDMVYFFKIIENNFEKNIKISIETIQQT
jgi:hypothetical protein